MSSLQLYINLVPSIFDLLAHCNQPVVDENNPNKNRGNQTSEYYKVDHLLPHKQQAGLR
jgi:hypothetical protein